MGAVPGNAVLCGTCPWGSWSNALNGAQMARGQGKTPLAATRTLQGRSSLAPLRPGSQSGQISLFPGPEGLQGYVQGLDHLDPAQVYSLMVNWKQTASVAYSSHVLSKNLVRKERLQVPFQSSSELGE